MCHRVGWLIAAAVIRLWLQPARSKYNSQRTGVLRHPQTADGMVGVERDGGTESQHAKIVRRKQQSVNQVWQPGGICSRTGTLGRCRARREMVDDDDDHTHKHFVSFMVNNNNNGWR